MTRALIVACAIAAAAIGSTGIASAAPGDLLHRDQSDNIHCTQSRQAAINARAKNYAGWDAATQSGTDPHLPCS